MSYFPALYVYKLDHTSTAKFLISAKRPVFSAFSKLLCDLNFKDYYKISPIEMAPIFLVNFRFILKH